MDTANSRNLKQLMVGLLPSSAARHDPVRVIYFQLRNHHLASGVTIVMTATAKPSAAKHVCACAEGEPWGGGGGGGREASLNQPMHYAQKGSWPVIGSR